MIYDYMIIMSLIGPSIIMSLNYKIKKLFQSFSLILGFIEPKSPPQFMSQEEQDWEELDFS